MDRVSSHEVNRHVVFIVACEKYKWLFHKSLKKSIYFCELHLRKDI